VLTWPAIVIAALTATGASTGLSGIRYTAPPPDFSIPTPTGGVQDLHALRGRVVVIDFWATWCDVCTDEMKYFVRAKQQFGDRIAVVTISNEEHDVAASYFRQREIRFPVVEDLTGSISRLYSVSKIPITLVLDPAGNVSYVSVGGLSWEELDNAISSALSPSTPAPRVLR
jgi:cytochrome c biogenesis protein CcmG, thiol:disulfide interchange protein DsbE